jgi:non-heme chloroperoxidase
LRTLTIKTPDGVNVVVQKWGICEGPAILFVHGFSQSHLSWTKQVSSDLAHTFYMVTYDLRGHGQSDKPLEAVFYTESPRWADEVQAVMEGTGLRRPVLVGWSYGGRIVTDYLMKYGDKGVAGVAYVSANTNRDLNASSPALTVQAGMASDRLTTNLESTRAFVRLCFGRPPTQDEFETVVGFNMLTPAQVRGYMGSRATPYEATLKGLRIPVLVAHGEEDQVVLPAVGQYTLKTVPGAKGSFYPGIGHSPFWEDPERFNAELKEFVKFANTPSVRFANGVQR